MKLDFIEMNLKFAEQIKTWRYHGFMKHINMDAYFESAKTTEILKGPGGCDGFAVVEGDDLFGLWECYHKPDGIIEIGLAISPDYVGKGLSKDFIEAGIRFTVDKYSYTKDYIQLSVDKGNIIALKAYLKAGFVQTDEMDNEIKMVYEVK